jgi:hypothetical protein
VVDLVAGELYDQTEFVLTEKWLYAPHDPGAPADHDPLADLERVFTAHVAGRNDLVAAAQLVAIVRQEESHLNV